MLVVVQFDNLIDWRLNILLRELDKRKCFQSRVKEDLDTQSKKDVATH